MNKLALIIALPLVALTACGEEPAPEPVETEVVAPAPVSSIAAPDEALFAELFASTCPAAEPVATSVCRRAMGAETVSCEFGLGDDAVLRNDATLELDETGENWQFADAEALCAAHS